MTSERRKWVSRYDACYKQLLQFKPLAAAVLQISADEFKGLTRGQIEARIEVPQDSAKTTVHPRPTSPHVRGENVEVVDDGTKMLFDSLFTVQADTGILRVNIELQKTNDPELNKRGIYYIARVISAQKSRGVFEGSDYGGLQKVYSIWLMIDAPKSLVGFVDCKYLVEKRFRPGKEGVFLQNDPVKSEICLVKVYLPEGDVSAADGDPMNILGVAFHDDRTVAEKEKFLENNGIVINDYVEGVMDKMASIGEWAVARLEAKVKKQVEAQVAQQVEQRVAQQVEQRVAQQVEQRVAQQVEQRVAQQVEQRVAQQVAEKEAEFKTQMAEKMLHQGLPADVVQKISGLDPAVVSRLSAASQSVRL